MPRRNGIVFYLLAQRHYVVVHHPVADVEAGTPHFLKQVLAREYASPAAHESRQQLQLRVRGFHALAVAAQLETRQVQLAAAKAMHFATRFRHAAAKHGPDARAQFPRAERLGHVIVRPEVQPQNLLGLLRLGGLRSCSIKRQVSQTCQIARQTTIARNSGRLRRTDSSLMFGGRTVEFSIRRSSSGVDQGCVRFLSGEGTEDLALDGDNAFRHLARSRWPPCAQARIERLPHFAHAACVDGREDFRTAELRCWRERLSLTHPVVDKS